jgi:hypothetical protein
VCGLLASPDGSRYEGLYVDGKRHGQGIKTYANGNRWAQAQRFHIGGETPPKHHAATQALQHRYAPYWTDKDSIPWCRFEGRFESNRRAEGTLSYAKGGQYTGAFTPEGKKTGEDDCHQDRCMPAMLR